MTNREPPFLLISGPFISFFAVAKDRGRFACERRADPE
jgi:hypothetical protein